MMRGSDDEACDKKWQGVWVEVTIKVAVTMKVKTSNDDFELKWRWRKKVNGNYNEGINVRDDQNVDESQLKVR